MSRSAFRMSCLLAGVGIGMAAFGLLLQSLVPVIAWMIYRFSSATGEFDAAGFVPHLGLYYAVAGLCVLLGLAFAVSIYRRGRPPVADAQRSEMPGSEGYQRAV